jgi:putative protease
VQIGISALKIEGRYKDADYVALTTQAYRQAVDEAWAGNARPVDAATELQLEQVYSRGLGPHFISGTNHQAVVNGRAPRHCGVLMGRVTRVADGAVTIEPAAANSIAPLKPGDGVVFDAADWRSPQEHEEGGRVYEVAMRDCKLELRFGNGAIDASRIRVGDLVWRTHDPDLDKAVRPFLEAAMPVHKQPVLVRVRAREGAPLEAEWRVGNVSVTVQSPEPLGTARNRGLDADFLKEQFGRLGNTPYELSAIELDVEGSPFAPSSLLNQLRREAVERLQDMQAATHIEVRDPAAELARLRGAAPIVSGGSAELHLLVRTPEQLEAAIDFRPSSITLDYLDLYGLRPSLERVRAAGLQPRVASPRVLKPGEERIADFLVSCDCPILVRSAGLLNALRGRPHGALTGDFSLNAANAISAAELFELGLSILTPTHDLNAAQVADLARQAGADRIEAVVFHHLPVFHTEHCVFCRFLSSGTSYLDCGRPCEKHRVALRDAAGREHPVMADVGCRNTVFGAEAQQAAMHLDDWRDAGIRHFRIEFAHQSAAQASRIAMVFEEALVGRRTGRELAQVLQRTAPQGVTEGSLFVPGSALTVLA